ncbi:SRPBCC family protein [Streptomyces sp. NPDC002889]|uniref:SRPBCC family protein n=1 Tax=Streptomyces sp. NPDC002889 TaxID=3364669 RepID=UPI0036A91FE9
MAKTDQNLGDGLDKLRGELGNYVGARVGHLADAAGDKLAGVTDKLLDSAESGGSLLPGLNMKSLLGAGAKSIKDSVVDKAKGVFGGKGKRKSGTTKVMNIIEVLDVGVPIRTAYDHWTQYEKFSSFTKGVRDASKDDEINSAWKVKVGPSTRSWKGKVQEQVPDDRIIWTSEGAKGTTRGCVSFHELAPALTRIVLVVEYYPSGFFEKTGNIWRAQGRRLRLDFKHFQRYVTLTAEEPEGWRGEIRDGEVVRTHEEALEDEESADQDENAEDEYDEDVADEEEDDEEDDAPEDAYEEDEDVEDEEEDEGADRRG